MPHSFLLYANGWGFLLFASPTLAVEPPIAYRRSNRGFNESGTPQSNHGRNRQMRQQALHSGLRIRVTDVLELLGAGASYEEILADYPFLEREDILVVLDYAAHPSFSVTRFHSFSLFHTLKIASPLLVTLTQSTQG
jgi:hypothetical protein